METATAVEPTLSPRVPWHYLPTMATAEEARAAAEALGFQVRWIVAAAMNIEPFNAPAAQQSETIAALLAAEAAHYGRLALGEGRA